MKTNKLFLLIGLLCLATSLQAQHTFSIVAVDPATGEIGSAGATCLDIDDLGGEEGALVISDIILGIGAINTQAAWNPINQVAARERMELGDSPQEIIDWLVANDPAPGTIASRQYGVVDLIGGSGGTPRSSGYTGMSNSPVANHITGPNYSIQGNILISQAVLDDMETEFLNTTGTLADKLMAAMQGAKRVGADNRCTSNQTSSKSAFLRVAKTEDLYTNYGHLTVDLNVSKTDFAEDPIDVLQTTYDFYLNNPGTTCDDTVNQFPYVESFETDLGLWEQNDIELSQVGNTDFDWTRNSGETPTAGTGPTAAADGDFYLYTEATGSNIGFPTKRAVLNSPCFDFTAITEASIVFNFHMLGNNTGNLAVRVNNGTGWNTIWLMEGNQGDQWNTANIDLSAYAGQTIQIRLDSTTGLGERSDVAIDNIRVLSEILGVNELAFNAISVFPNPTTDSITILAPNAMISQITVYDVNGKAVAQELFNNGTPNYTINMASLRTALYFVKIETEAGTVFKRIVKK